MGDLHDVTMSEWIAYLGSEILRAPPAVVIPTAILLSLVLIRLVLALPSRPGAVVDNGLEREARRWIGDRIEEHLEVLAEAYGEAGAGTDQDDPPPGFTMTIESFIADVLLRELDQVGFDIDLRGAVREFVVLHRAEIYEDMTTRIQKLRAV